MKGLEGTVKNFAATTETRISTGFLNIQQQRTEAYLLGWLLRKWESGEACRWPEIRVTAGCLARGAGRLARRKIKTHPAAAESLGLREQEAGQDHV